MASPAKAKDYLGSIDFFGKTRPALRKHGHGRQAGGDGFTQSFDATRVIASLQQERRWDPDELSIALIPVNATPPGVGVRRVQARAAAAVEAANVQHKRVSLRTVAGGDE